MQQVLQLHRVIYKYSGIKEQLLYKLSKVHHSSSSASSSSGSGTSEISRQGTKRKADAALQGANAVKVYILLLLDESYSIVMRVCISFRLL